MIKECEIVGLHGQDKPISLKMIESLMILTGDNGAGKTTLLNIVFNVLNADFESLINTKFKEIKINLEENVLKLLSIEVKKSKNKLEVGYFFDKFTNFVLLERSITGWVEYSYDFQEYPLENDVETDYDYTKVFDEELESEFDFDIIDDLENLITRHPQLKFINDIKKSILYFPTYRRVDSDIKSLLEGNYFKSNSSYKNFTEINKSINNFPNDRRVIGVGDEDIEVIYNSYSQELRQFNSIGLNELLKKFISSIITSIYTNKNSKNNRRKELEELKLYENAATHLVELAEKLGIEGIDKEQVSKYFSKQNELRQNSNVFENASLEISITSRNKIHTNKKIENDKELIQLFSDSIKSIGKEKNFIIELITLYREHLYAQETQLEPIRYLQRGVENFFKGKVTVELDEKTYSISLTTPFKELSTGEKQLITILSYIGLTLKENKFKPLIIIDEPELSLHISWQNKLLPQLLEMQDARFLIATHSPYIANIKYRKHMKQLGEIDGNI